jgi:hypothetical protein
MRLPMIALLAACCTSPCWAESASASKQGVALTIHRAADKAVLCLSTRAPVQLSGEYGVHASWSGRVPAKPLELYSKEEHFPLPVRVELPLPRDARALRVEVGACIDNDSCDMVEFNYDLRRLKASGDTQASCER